MIEAVARSKGESVVTRPRVLSQFADYTRSEKSVILLLKSSCSM